MLDNLDYKDAVIGTTGMLSRELFELRAAADDGHDRDFLTVGSMGHAASIALGVALGRPQKKVFCLDGDGSVLMHMGQVRRRRVWWGGDSGRWNWGWLGCTSVLRTDSMGWLVVFQPPYFTRSYFYFFVPPGYSSPPWDR